MPRPQAHGGLPQELASRDGSFVIEDLQAEIYHLVDRASSTMLKAALQSGAHAQHQKQWPKTATDAMAFGTLVHMMLEMPDWRSEVGVMPKMDLRTKAGKETKAAWLKDNEEIVAITSDQLDALVRIEDSCKSSDVISGFMENGQHEVSGFWTSEMGLKCKFRADLITSDAAIVDWKTCRDASRFIYDCKSYKYDIQAAHYLNGLSAVTDQNCQDFFFVAIENVPPYGVMTYHLDYECLERAQKKLSDAMLTYQENYGRTHWRGYPDRVIDISF